MEKSQICGAIEAILYVTGEPIETAELARALDLDEEQLASALDELEHFYDKEMRGFRLLRFGEHVQLGTRQDYASYIEKLLQPVQKQSLSQAVMETLAQLGFTAHLRLTAHFSVSVSVPVIFLLRLWYLSMQASRAHLTVWTPPPLQI